MTLKQINDYAKANGLPEDVQVGLVDLTTDNMSDANYSINLNDLTIEEGFEHEGDEKGVTALYITFENKLNNNPI